MYATSFVSADKIVDIIKAHHDNTMWHELHSMPYAQCKVGILNVDKNGEDIYVVFLKSYETIVCGYVLDTDYTYMFCTGTYSKTTAKQIGRFAREFSPLYSYHTFKVIAGFDKQCAVANADTMEYVIAQCDRYTGGKTFGTHNKT